MNTLRTRLTAALARICGCGHDHDTHQHYRAGTDCGLCGCQRYRRTA